MYPPTSNGFDNHSDQKPAPHGQPAMFTGVPVNPNFQDPATTGLRTRPINNVPWSHGLFDCFSDMKTCCISLWCPCVTFGRVAEIMDEGSTSCGASGALYTLILFITGCPCWYSCFYRSKMRNRYQLQSHPCNDCLVHCCCETCALTQEYRELERRGFDMSIGWQANMIRQSHGIAMTQIPPGVQGGMTR